MAGRQRRALSRCRGTGTLSGMANRSVAASETELRVKPELSLSAPWLAVALAVVGAGSYVVSMVLPYYAGDLDRFPLEQMPWGMDYSQVWPYDTDYSFAVDLAGMYAVWCAPFVAAGVLLWAMFRARYWPALTRLANAVTLMAAAVSAATLVWLMTPLGSTLASWWLF